MTKRAVKGTHRHKGYNNHEPDTIHKHKGSHYKITTHGSSNLHRHGERIHDHEGGNQPHRHERIKRKVMGVGDLAASIYESMGTSPEEVAHALKQMKTQSDDRRRDRDFRGMNY
mgnify:CR=1 FL=1